MWNFIILLLWIVTGIFPAFFSQTAIAGTFEVAPTTISLSPETQNGVLYITNRGQQPVYIQIEAFDWKQTQKGDELTPSEALLVNPPMAELQPGRKKTIRLAVAKDNIIDNKERSFRLLISELPSSSITGNEGVNVLLQFSVPLFITPIKKSPIALEWSIKNDDGDITLVAKNNGDRHVKLSGVKIQQFKSKEMDISKDSFKYILPGSAAYWKIASLPLLQGEKYSITAKDDIDGALHSTITAPP
jgi:fimbrial chaperone protein